MKQARGTLDQPMGMEIRRLGERRGLVPCCFVMMDAYHEMDERRGMGCIKGSYDSLGMHHMGLD